MSGREPKRRWALHHVNSSGEKVAWPGFTFTARGRDKAERKILRILSRRPGAARLIDIAPHGWFSLEPVQ